MPDGFDDNVMVSVLCLAYNHEKYIRQTLDGFVRQRTNFNYEILIHDDASTDATADIIREYEKKYPFIKPVYQTENQYSQQNHKPIIETFLLPKAKGKYVAWCEGDDFWTDEEKLQKQVDLLEQNTDCIAAISNVSKANINGVPYGIISDWNLEGIVSGDNLIRYCLFPGGINTLSFHLSGLLLRKEVYLSYACKPPQYKKEFDVGDIPLFLFIGQQGNVCYTKETMSCYRVGNTDSWYGNLKKEKTAYIDHYEREKQAFLAFNRFTEGKYEKEALKAVQLREFYAIEKKYDIHGLMSPEKRSFFRALPLKRQLKDIVFHYIPHAESAWIMLKKLRYKR